MYRPEKEGQGANRLSIGKNQRRHQKAISGLDGRHPAPKACQNFEIGENRDFIVLSALPRRMRLEICTCTAGTGVHGGPAHDFGIAISRVNFGCHLVGIGILRCYGERAYIWE